MRYLITFSCYGTHLHGDEDGAVDRHGHNLFGGPAVAENLKLREYERSALGDDRYSLDGSSRLSVVKTLREVCEFRKWTLLAAHVRSTHVHSVVEAEAKPEKIMNDFKSYASRSLSKAEACVRKRWARHGSTRWLFTDESVRQAIRYVIDEQGGPMAVFDAGLM